MAESCVKQVWRDGKEKIPMSSEVLDSVVRGCEASHDRRFVASFTGFPAALASASTLGSRRFESRRAMEGAPASSPGLWEQIADTLVNQCC